MEHEVHTVTVGSLRGRVYRRTASGGWSIEYRTRPPGGRSVRVRVQAGSTRAQAEAELVRRLALEAAVRAGAIPPERARTHPALADLSARWMADCVARGLAPKTIAGYRERLLDLERNFPAHTVDEITPAAWSAFIERRRRDGVSGRTINYALGTLRRFLEWSRRHGLVASNPAADLPMVARPRAVKRRRALGADEVARLLSKSPPPLDMVWLTFLHTGLRFRELALLRWGDVHLDAGFLEVRSGSAKGGRARSVPMDRALVGALKSHRKARGRPPALAFFQGLLERRNHRRNVPLTRGQVRELAGERADLARELVFVNRNWMPWGRLTDHLDRCLRLSGIDPEGVDVHALRTSFITAALDDGMALQHVQEIVGHSDVRTTLAHYYKARPEALRRAVLDLENRRENGHNGSQGE